MGWDDSTSTKHQAGAALGGVWRFQMMGNAGGGQHIHGLSHSMEQGIVFRGIQNSF
jgi:uncharacterized protein YndB with AHSA1/START domain